jgi:DNA repair protein RecO (recombination protein O)
MPLYRDVGVVLRTYKLGEADRIVTLMTQDSGKVRAVAKGIRKTKSKFGSRLEPMSHVQVQLYRGRELDIVNQVELVEVTNLTRGNLEATTDGLAMCEIVEQMSHDRSPSQHLYRMLVGALRQLNREYTALLLPALQFRLLESEGVGPCVDRCVICGTTEQLVDYDVTAGGMQCRQHRGGMPISSEAVVILQDVLNGRIAQVLRRTDVPTVVVRELVSLGRTAMEHHLERRIRSTSLFEAPQLG